MLDASLVDRVRRLVLQAFVELGLAEPSEIHETILVRDGYYCGRRFETQSASAIWFVEENQVKVFQADGRVARVLDLCGERVRTAA
jgi:hypothetical protein